MGLGVPGQGPSARWDVVLPMGRMPMCRWARARSPGAALLWEGSQLPGRVDGAAAAPRATLIRSTRPRQPQRPRAADPGEALSLLAAQRRSFGKHTREVREMALLWETFPGQVEEGTGWFLEERRLCQYHGKGRAGRKTDALAVINIPCLVPATESVQAACEG